MSMTYEEITTTTVYGKVYFKTVEQSNWELIDLSRCIKCSSIVTSKTDHDKWHMSLESVG